MRMLHTMFRVGDLGRSLQFYTEVLGMKLLRRASEGRFTLVYLGYGEERDTAVLELTHNWDTSRYELGNAYGHIAIGVDDVYAACEAIRGRGGKIVRDAGPMKGVRPCSPSWKTPTATRSSCLRIRRAARLVDDAAGDAGAAPASLLGQVGIIIATRMDHQ